MSKFTVTATWDDVPHLDERTKKELWDSIPPYQRDSRSKGVPSLGPGAIYPVPESEIRVADFELPAHYPRVWALDTGWKHFGCVWGALDRETQIVYLYREYVRGQAEPPIHVDGIKASGVWIPGVGDAAAVNLKDGRSMIEIYRELGLDIELPDKSLEAGILDVWQRLSSGKLKVFASLQKWFEAFRLYRRDDNGGVVKIVSQTETQRFDLMDCTRYLIRSGLKRAIVKPVKREPVNSATHGPRGWMA
jgi:hypothetical protein